MKQLKTFAAYVAPSVFACALSGIYAIVDGFFVGNSVGDIGPGNRDRHGRRRHVFHKAGQGREKAGGK